MKRARVLKSKRRVRRNSENQELYDMLCFDPSNFPDPEFDEDWMAGCGPSKKDHA